METNVYWLWLLSMGSLIFLMQAGFFLLEGGQVRSRDVANVMMKMTGHLGLGIIVFLVGGFAIKQYGWPILHLPNGWRYPWEFVGDGGQSITFYVSLMFALVSCAIPSGSFSGRNRRQGRGAADRRMARGLRGSGRGDRQRRCCNPRRQAPAA